MEWRAKRAIVEQSAFGLARADLQTCREFLVDPVNLVILCAQRCPVTIQTSVFFVGGFATFTQQRTLL